MNSNLKILFVSPWYPNKYNPTLGIFIKRKAETMAALHDVTVMHACYGENLGYGSFKIEMKKNGHLQEILIYYGRSHSIFPPFRKIKNYLSLRKAYREGLKKMEGTIRNIDLIHLHIPWPIGLIIRQISKKLQKPYIVSEHWTGYSESDGRYRGWLMKWITKKTISDARFIITESDYVSRQMQKHGIRGNFVSVPNVVDTEIFSPEEASPKKRFIHISSLDDQQKNVSGLIRAFALARTIEPELELTIIGAGNDIELLKKLAAELNLNNNEICFTGLKTGHELANYLKKSTALILNSRYENQPVVILEALSSGIPVIATNVGSIPELIDQDKGIIINSEDQNNLVNAMIEMHRKRKRYESKKIREFAVENFSIPIIAQKLDKIYRKAIA